MPILEGVITNNQAYAMLSDSLDADFTYMLNAAQRMQIIDTWKVLGPVFMVRQSDANFYVKPGALERLLKNLCAKC